MANPTPNTRFLTKGRITSFMLLMVVLISSPSQAANLCANVNDLRLSYQVLQSDGGIWSYMERDSSLKDKSFLGLQIDTKLVRCITVLEEKCKESSDESLVKEVESKLGDARMLRNIRPGQTSAEELMKKIEDLNDDIGKVVEKITQ